MAVLAFLPSLIPGYSATMRLAIVLGGVFLLGIVLATKTRYRRGLKKVPGPFWASISPLDRIITSASGQQFKRHLEYHDKYGPVVRVGPNQVSFSNSDLIPQVYGITSRFYKSDFYSTFDVKSKQGKPFPTVFSVRDEKHHKALKRPVASAYSMSTLVELEPMTDSCIDILQRKFDGMQDKDFDLGEWLQWYSFDVITSITFSDCMGFMEQEKDVQGVIEAIEGRLFYNSVIGEASYLHKILLGNPLVARLIPWIPALAWLNSGSHVLRFAAKQLERYSGRDKSQDSLRDMLSRFRRSRDGEEVMSNDELLSHASSNILAGSDTTAISLRSMFYYLCKNPRCYNLVQNEIDRMEDSGDLSPIVTFAEANRMPYLQACMKEAMRLHPAVGMLLERIVPTEGFEIAPGIHLPAGTCIGINPWLPSRDKSVYGPDAEQFRPERWLEANEATLKLMERNFLAFGAGARTCLGKNISLLEMSKLVPQVIRKYHLELSDPKAEWVLTDHWFVKQTNLICRLTRRER